MGHNSSGLMDSSGPSPSLPPGHPFVDVQLGNCWTASVVPDHIVPDGGNNVSIVSTFDGAVTRTSSVGEGYYWCVRGS